MAEQAKEILRDKQIKKEIAKLKTILKDIDDDRKKIIEQAIENAAWMAIALKDLREEININGYDETYQNGANQFGKKESIPMKNYNTIIKNYTTLIRLFLDQLPNDIPEKDDEFDEFLSKK